MSVRGEGFFHALGSLLRRPVSPHYPRYHGLGWIVLLLFLGQAVTGLLLALYYQPTQDMAAESARYIMRDVHWGWLIRGLHYWAAQGMIVFTFLWLFAVFARGAYRGDRAPRWYLGLLLMLLILGFTWTGDLLTWDNEAYWSATLALQTIESVPMIGPALVSILGGGSEVASSTLGRTYAVHSVLLPGLFVSLFVLHRSFVRWLREQREKQT